MGNMADQNRFWSIKIDFGRSNAKIGRKMTSGRLLFLALGFNHGVGLHKLFF